MVIFLNGGSKVDPHCGIRVGVARLCNTYGQHSCLEWEINSHNGLLPQTRVEDRTTRCAVCPPLWFAAVTVTWRAGSERGKKSTRFPVHMSGGKGMQVLNTAESQQMKWFCWVQQPISTTALSQEPLSQETPLSAWNVKTVEILKMNFYFVTQSWHNSAVGSIVSPAKNVWNEVTEIVEILDEHVVGGHCRHQLEKKMFVRDCEFLFVFWLFVRTGWIWKIDTHSEQDLLWTWRRSWDQMPRRPSVLEGSCVCEQGRPATVPHQGVWCSLFGKVKEWKVELNMNEKCPAV